SYDANARIRFYDGLAGALAADGRVAGSAFANGLPGTRLPQTRFMLEGVEYSDDPDQLPIARIASVSGDFFGTFAVQALAGRVFGPEDTPDGLPVALVSRRFVERYLDGADPIGRRIRPGRAAAEGPWRTIVGVVPDLWLGGFDAPPGDRNPAGIYVPLAQAPPTTVGIALKSRGEPASVAELLRTAAFAQDPDVPVYQVKSMDQLL